MWHEARKQEKLIRSQMIDSVKRNERRKQFYENVRRDPEQFMQIHGRKCQIHVDPAIWRAAEASNILRKWQGDSNILIDRFDARSHLDFIAEKGSFEPDKRTSEDIEELQCEYERYRILILNEFEKVPEHIFLQEIAQKEFWPVDPVSQSVRVEAEKKKQSREKKAAVAFAYEDTQTVGGKPESDESEDDDDEFIEPEEFDLKFDVDALDPERIRSLNKFGMKYGIALGAFSRLLKMDRREQDETHQLKEIEKAKLALAVCRQAKAERALLKKKRALIVGKGCLNEEATTTLLSFVTQSKKEFLETSTSSSSQDEEETTEFITSFGGEVLSNRGCAQDEDFDDEGSTAAVHGPALPSAEFRRIFELKTRKSPSPEDFGSLSSSRKGGRYRARSPSPFRRRSFERSSHRNHSRSRSRDREMRKSREKGKERVPSDRTRSRSTDRLKNAQSKDCDRREKEANVKRRRMRDSTSTRSSSSEGKKGTGSVLSPSRGNGDTSPLEIRSSMSESEKERIEVENRRRRIRRTAKLHRQRHGSNANDSSEDESERKAILAHRLKVQMQRALKKTAEELKEEERQKREEQFRERRRRDERLHEESLERKRRYLKERERRHRRHSGSRRHSSSSSC